MAKTRRPSRVERKTEGYYPTRWQGREQARFAALYDEVGLQPALKMCDDVILWITERPDNDRLTMWARMYDDGEIVVPPEVRENVSRKVANWGKQQHFAKVVISPANLADKIVTKMQDFVDADREFPGNWPTTLSYLYAGSNYGMREGGYGSKKGDQTMNVGTLNINAGPPPPKKLKVKKPKQLAAIEGEFREVV